MADKINEKWVSRFGNSGGYVKERYKDMGDGTHALVVDATLDASGAQITVDQGAAGDAAPALATNARGVIGWLRKIADVLLGTLKVTTPLGAPITFQQVATLGAVALPANVLQNGGILKAADENTGKIYLGPSGVTAANGYPLNAGGAASVAALNTNTIYMIGTVAGDSLAFIGN